MDNKTCACLIKYSNVLFDFIYVTFFKILVIKEEEGFI